MTTETAKAPENQSAPAEPIDYQARTKEIAAMSIRELVAKFYAKTGLAGYLIGAHVVKSPHFGQALEVIKGVRNFLLELPKLHTAFSNGEVPRTVMARSPELAVTEDYTWLVEPIITMLRDGQNNHDRQHGVRLLQSVFNSIWTGPLPGRPDLFKCVPSLPGRTERVVTARFTIDTGMLQPSHLLHLFTAPRSIALELEAKANASLEKVPDGVKNAKAQFEHLPLQTHITCEAWHLEYFTWAQVRGWVGEKPAS